MQARLLIHGHLTFRLFDSDGALKLEKRVNNIVTNAGRALIIDKLQGTSALVADYIAIGTNNTAAAAGDTALGTETARAQGTLSQPDAYTDRCVYTFGAGVGTGNITEAGRLTANVAGTLMGRAVFAGIDKQAGDSLEVTYDFTYAAG